MLFKYFKVIGLKKLKYFKLKSSYMYFLYMDGLIYKKLVCGFIVVKDLIGYKIIYVLLILIIWDKIFIIYLNK